MTNPIEALKRAQIYNCRSADPEHCKLPICTDARVALEDVEALVAAGARVLDDLDSQNGEFEACTFCGDPQEHTETEECNQVKFRTAVAKFTEAKQ